MKRFLPFIIILITVVQLFAPITFGSGIKKNITEAADEITIELSNIALSSTKADITAAAHAPKGTLSGVDYSKGDEIYIFVNIYNPSGGGAVTEQKTRVGGTGAFQNIKLNNVESNTSASGTFNFNSLSQDTEYNFVGTLEKSDANGVRTVLAISTNPTIRKTPGDGQTDLISQGSSRLPSNDTDGLPKCSIIAPTRIGGCIAQGLYYLFFKTTSFVFGLAGKILDFAVMYSIQDSSYRSTFVVEGWGLVRDFCNMFFIFILLYIAFGTILNLHSVKTKEMIINVVIIGLLINFSLFATQVIIDASNILTRVFYNQNTIITGSAEKDAEGNIVKVNSELGEFGEIKLSEAIVSKVDPQKLIIQASEVSKIPQKGVNNEDEETYGDEGISVGSFILVTLLATAVNVVGIIAFLAAGIVFIGRVIGLWLAMILAPIAFFSYTVPALQGMSMIGWKKWWPETLSLAFLAPIFTFFMYLIVGFMDKGLGIMNADSKTGINFVVAIIVPFIFVMILLLKAKDIAKSMSGTMGQSITNAIGAVGGMALGAGVGGLAMAGRQTIGRLATNMSQSNMMRDWAGKSKIGASALKMTSGVASKSFDFRGTKLGGMAGKELGADLGKAKSGGFVKEREDKIHKEEEFAKKLLDTTDYGKIKIQDRLSKGNVDNKEADEIVKAMTKSGNDNAEFVKDKNGQPLNASALRAKLITNPEMAKIAAKATTQTIADQMSSARRSDRAKNLSTGINGIFITNKIAANKIRKDPAALAKARDTAGAFKQLSAELKKSEGDAHKKEEHKAPADSHKEPAHAKEEHNDHGAEHKAGH